MPDFATSGDFAMPENSGIFSWNFPAKKMPANPVKNARNQKEACLIFLWQRLNASREAC